MNEDNDKEDYRAIWRQFYCAIISSFKPSSLSYERIEPYAAAAHAADESLEIYLKRKAKLREYNLMAFK